ncbi:MAG: ABC transporter substrate-binding protein [Halobacteriales archaeon]
MSTLAGCSGGSDGGGSGDTETEADSGGGSGGSTETEMDSGSSMGDALPEYRYFNNPPNYNPARNDAINLMGEQLNKAGFNMNVKVFEWGTLYNKVTSEQDFEFTTWHRGLGIDPGRRYPEMFHSSNTGPGQGNFVGYVNKDLDPKLMKQMQTTDRQERINLLHDIQEVITRDCPINAITQMPILVAYNSDQVSGWVDHLGGYNYYYNMTSIEVNNKKNQLRGSWSETLGTLNVLGFNNETKLLHQFDVLYDNLIRFNPDLQPDPKLGLATDWERPEKTTMRYTIRDHQWHDGEDLTAEDVAFTLNYIKENEIPLYSTQTDMYSDAEAVDSQTVQVNFTEDGAPGPVHTLFSSQIPILPQHIWEGRDQPNKMQVKEPIGSGPMKFDYWDTGSELGLVKNSDHWRPTNFDSRIWRIIPESSTVWSLLKQGELNYLPFSRIGKQLSDNQELDQIGVKQMPGDSWWHMSMNERVPGLDQRAVRQACVHSIPKTAIVKQLLYGFPDKGFNLISPAFGEFHNPDVMRFEEGVEPAKKRLKEAGFKFDDDGKAHFPAN